MTEIVVRTRLKRDQVRRLLASIPAICAGRLPDPSGAQLALQTVVGQAALMLIKKAYVAKAAGGTDDLGDSWAPLAPSTVKGRRKGPGAGKDQILRDTGVLLNSLTPGGPGNVLAPEPGAVTVGTEVPYAKYHHHGTPKMPARPLWPEPYRWPDEWWDRIGEEARDAVARLVQRLLGGGP